MWIKICGMTSPDAVEAALAGGADAIGFVFAQSPREVTPERARELAAPARGVVSCVAVTKHPDRERLRSIFEVFQPDWLQTDLEDLRDIVLPRRVLPLPVLRAGRPESAAPLPAQVLFEGPASGTGLTTDWTEAARLARGTRLVLAGGLRASNVGEAIATVRPWGVDVSSGVESEPGVKSPAMIREFIESARLAGWER